MYVCLIQNAASGGHYREESELPDEEVYNQQSPKEREVPWQKRNEEVEEQEFQKDLEVCT